MAEYNKAEYTNKKLDEARKSMLQLAKENQAMRVLITTGCDKEAREIAKYLVDENLQLEERFTGSKFFEELYDEMVKFVKMSVNLSNDDDEWLVNKKEILLMIDRWNEVASKGVSPLNDMIIDLRKIIEIIVNRL